MANSTASVPSRKVSCASKPSRNTSSIALFSDSTSAMNRVMPLLGDDRQPSDEDGAQTTTVEVVGDLDRDFRARAIELDEDGVPDEHAQSRRVPSARSGRRPWRRPGARPWRCPPRPVKNRRRRASRHSPARNDRSAGSSSCGRRANGHRGAVAQADECSAHCRIASRGRSPTWQRRRASEMTPIDASTADRCGAAAREVSSDSGAADRGGSSPPSAVRVSRTHPASAAGS